MFLDAVQQLLEAKIKAQQGEAPSVTISLPRDDPRAQQLLAFAQKLMLPTTKVLDSGLITKTGTDSAEQTDLFLKELRRVVGDELFNTLMNDLDSQVALKKPVTRPDLSGVTAESLLGAALGGIATPGGLEG
jgi:hypothetical protein